MNTVDLRLIVYNFYTLHKLYYHCITNWLIHNNIVYFTLNTVYSVYEEEQSQGYKRRKYLIFFQ